VLLTEVHDKVKNNADGRNAAGILKTIAGKPRLHPDLADLERRTRRRNQRHRFFVIIFALGLSGSTLLGVFGPLKLTSQPSNRPDDRLLAPAVGANIPLELFPEDVAVTQDAVWVSVHDANFRQAALVRLDPQTNEVVATIPLEARLQHLVAGEGALWGVSVVRPAGDGSEQRFLVRVDPHTNQVAATIPDIAAPVAAGNGAVWAVGNAPALEGAHILRIDSRSNQVVATIDLGYEGVSAITTTEGSVWALAFRGSGDEDLVRVNATSNQVETTIPAGGTYGLLAADSEGVWLSKGGTIPLLIDPRTNTVIGEGDSLSRFAPFAAGGGGVWFLGRAPDGAPTLSHLTRDGFVADATVALPSGVAWVTPPSIALDTARDEAWIADETKSVTRIDLNAGG
jgi:hypothetical protein